MYEQILLSVPDDEMISFSQVIKEFLYESNDNLQWTNPFCEK